MRFIRGLTVVLVIGFVCSVVPSLAGEPIMLRGIDVQGSLPSDDSVYRSPPEREIPLHSTIINLNAGSGISSNDPALDAFNRAAQNWQNYLRDDVVLNIDIDMDSLGTGILGSASSTAYNTSFDYLRGLMVAGGDSGSSIEASTLSYLPTLAQYTANAPAGFTPSGRMEATRANLLALGEEQDDLDGLGTPDGEITFSTNFDWDYDNTNGITGGVLRL